jgi:hypothetical protein
MQGVGGAVQVSTLLKTVRDTVSRTPAKMDYRLRRIKTGKVQKCVNYITSEM